ncbi:MAG: hypothetical protein HYX84_02545 [Chloroflexi bacterium]|nr:hypothetical protein [Chloroflexota bacterium]
MPAKDLSGKTVFDLGPEDFDMLYCRFCKEHPCCNQDFKTINVCQQLIDSGIWDNLYRKRLQGLS